MTGGMIFIGIMNVAIGFCSYDKPSDTHDRIHVVIPPAAYRERPITVPTLGEPAGTQVSLTPDANPVDGQ